MRQISIADFMHPALRNPIHTNPNGRWNDGYRYVSARRVVAPYGAYPSIIPWTLEQVMFITAKEKHRRKLCGAYGMTGA